MHPTSKNRATRAALALCLLLVPLTLAGCFGEPESLLVNPAPGAGAVVSTEPTTTIEVAPTRVDYFDAAELVADGARFINVDTRDEFAAEHINGTANVPMSTLLGATTGWLEDDEIIVTSISESRARSAQAVLVREGFPEARYLVGGHDGWNGLFAGTDAREWTNPARIYHFTTSNVDELAQLFGDVTSKDLAELRTSTQGLEDEFVGDVEVEIVDLSTQLSTAINLVERYDVPLVVAEGQNYLLIPSWLLIDREGGVRYYDALPLDIALATIYGWSTEQVR